MSNRLYHDPRINIQNVANELEHTFLGQGYQVQHFGDGDHVTVQMRKGGDFIAIVGMQTALTVTMQRTPRGILTMVGQQQWVDKAVVGTVGLIASPILWPLMVTAGIGAIQQATLGTQVSNALDMAIRRQNPEVQFGPIPPDMMPHDEQSGMPHPSTPPQWQRWTSWARHAGMQQVVCPNCQTPNEVGDSYCMHCGQALTQPQPEKITCPNCGTEAKAGATFCTKCGTSLTQKEEPAQQN